MTDVRAAIGYSERTEKRPYFYANAHEKDFVPLKPAEVAIRDARGRGCELDVEGFTLVEHESALADLTDLEAVSKVHSREIADLLKRITGCDEVVMTPFGILRFSERSGANAEHDNSHPARFVHVDMARDDAAAARARSAPQGKPLARSAQYNVWRSLAGGTQDVPLGLCDYTSLAEDDLLACQAIFDPLDGSPEWGFANYLLAENPDHRWYYYSDMRPDEAIVFKTSESDPGRAQMMPHGRSTTRSPAKTRRRASAWKCAERAIGSRERAWRGTHEASYRTRRRCGARRRRLRHAAAERDRPHHGRGRQAARYAGQRPLSRAD